MTAHSAPNANPLINAAFFLAIIFTSFLNDFTRELLVAWYTSIPFLLFNT